MKIIKNIKDITRSKISNIFRGNNKIVIRVLRKTFRQASQLFPFSSEECRTGWMGLIGFGCCCCFDADRFLM
jgi:hypothetical protein